MCFTEMIIIVGYEDTYDNVDTEDNDDTEDTDDANKVSFIVS